MTTRWFRSQCSPQVSLPKGLICIGASLVPVTERTLCRAFIVVLMLLTSCGSENNKAIVQQSVEQFHIRIDSNQGHDIYIDGNDDFRKAGNETEFVAFIQAVHRKLGKVVSTHLNSYTQN